MTRKTRREKQRDAVSQDHRVDMTPMIDVVFLLIIFFLCIDFKVLEAKLPAYLPKHKGSMVELREPQPQLRLKIHCDKFGDEKLRPGSKTAYRLVGHEIHYTLDADRLETLADLDTKLSQIFRDKERCMVDDINIPGQMKVIGVVVEPDHGSVYGDVAAVVDALLTIGFPDVNFGGGLGSQENRKPAASPREGK